MQTVSVGISNVELTCAPRSVTDLSPVEIGASDRELFEEFIDVRNNESVRWSIALTKVLGLVPLKVQFNTVTPHASVFRFDGRVPQDGLEAKQLIELDGRGDVANHQYWLNRFQLRHRVALSECKPSAQRNAHQLQALKPAPAQTLVPCRVQGAYRPSGVPRQPGLSAACAG
jgi:hypothetical protein